MTSAGLYFISRRLVSATLLIILIFSSEFSQNVCQPFQNCHETCFVKIFPLYFNGIIKSRSNVNATSQSVVPAPIFVCTYVSRNIERIIIQCENNIEYKVLSKVRSLTKTGFESILNIEIEKKKR